MKNLLLKNLVFLLLISLNGFSQDGKFSFTIPTTLHVSAGVFKNDSVLVRTLWSDSVMSAGTYTRYWDGTDDYGNAITSPASTYKIKVLTNNIKYTWQGVIGNTSDAQTGSSVHLSYFHNMMGLAFGPTYGYMCKGYAEGANDISKFLIGEPNKKVEMVSAATGGKADINYVVTDGTYVYWGAFDSNAGSNTFVFATQVSNDAEVAFASGVPYSVVFARTYPSVISKMDNPISGISGLAVQRNGNYLFVARADLNQVQVLNKTTGALLQTLSYNTPRGLSVDGSDNLWMATGTMAEADTVARYSVNWDGTLSSRVITILGLSDPLATQVSPDGLTLAVADGGASQQVKFYNNSTGVYTKTLGVAGGYALDAEVDDDKFYFNSIASGNRKTFIAYQPDGSFWVNDHGNYRTQHFSKNRNYIDNIMSLGSSYITGVDKNDVKRVFMGYLEFEVDYSKPVENSWKLKKNWQATVPSTYDEFASMRNPMTLSNGKTYAFIRPSSHQYEVVELPKTGTLRRTGVLTGDLHKVLCSDGSLQGLGGSGKTLMYVRYPLTGFDGSGNPVWSSTADILATAQTDDVTGNPVSSPNDQIFSPTTNKVVLYNPATALNYGGTIKHTGYHLGLMQKGANNDYLFQTEKSTHKNYGGDFPPAGYFDIGNGVGYAGTIANILDHHIITSYHGEFWKGGQTNKFNHYYDNGLALGQFGTTRSDVGFSTEAAAGMAGNALTPGLIKDSKTGNLYLWHGDESDHSGIHRWEISGLNTINEQVVTIQFPATYTLPVVDFVDLMAGLPFSADLVNNTAGWTRTTLVNDAEWGAFTSSLSYDPLLGNTLGVGGSIKTAFAEKSVNRDLGTNNVTNSWKITGKIAYGGDANKHAESFVEVLDANDKILTNFYFGSTYPPHKAHLFGNGKSIVSNPGFYVDGAGKPVAVEIGIVNGVVTFLYGSNAPVTTTILDGTGNWRTPKTLRIRFWNNGNSGGSSSQVIYVRDLKFYKDNGSVNVAPNKAPVADAGTNQVITLPLNTVTLTGKGTDMDGTISSYAWAQISGPAPATIVSPNAATTAINDLAQGVYQFELTVTDNNGAVGKATVLVTVNSQSGINLLPAVNPANTVNGLDYSYYEGNWSILPDFSSLVPEKTGTSANFDISLANKSNHYGFSFTGFIEVPIDGQYTFFTTSDDGSHLYIDNVLVVDNDGIHGATEKSGTIGLKAGKHAIKGLYFQKSGGEVFLVSYEGMGISKQAIPSQVLYRVTLTNAPPVANAGADQTITLPTTSVTLNGSGIDGDGTISSYSWIQISGPSSGWIASSNSATTMILSLSPGVYQYELTVTDNNGAIGKDIVLVTVNLKLNNTNNNSNSNGGILLPAVYPLNIVNGLDYTYYEGNWSVLPDFSSLIPEKTGTTTNFDLSPANNPNHYGFSFTGFIEVPSDGEYTFFTTSDDGSHLFIDNVLVVDNDGTHGATEKSGTIGLKAGKHAIKGLYFQKSGGEVFLVSYEGMGISKQAIPSYVLYRVTLTNTPPVANAGADQTITLPTTSVTLTGSGTDGDGTISNYSWIQISGPASGWIASSNSATTMILSLLPGVYQYELTVTDNNGAVGKDTVQVSVIISTLNTLNLLPAVNPANTVNGLNYKYYEGNWSVLPDFTLLNPVKTGTTSNFDLSLKNRADQYGFNFTGFIEVPADGQYTFYTSSDDGSNLYIDNLLVVDNDGTHGAIEKSGTIGLKAGKHAITGLFFQQSGGEVFVVSYEGMGILKQAIPNWVLYKANTTPSANAGPDQTITHPTSTVTLTGSGTDTDGTISSYYWTRISGPLNGLIITPNLSGTLITGLTKGIYQYELTVTDNSGETGKDTVQVTVNALSTNNLLPAVNPANTVNGLDYSYYEGKWSVLPQFPLLVPVKTGTTVNFDLSLAERPTHYGFSFTGFIEVPADGLYTFYTSSDDGSNLYIDDVLIVDNDGLHGATEKSGIIGLKAGKHAIKGLFFQQGGGEVFLVSYEGMGISKQTIPASALYRVSLGTTYANNLLPAVNPANTVNGLDYKYYEGHWSVLPDFLSLYPVKTGTTGNFDLSLANRPDNYGFSFTGFIQVPYDGQYTFYTTSDDGSSLYIDNVLTVTNDGLHGANEESGTIGLKAGKHLIQGLFFQQGGGEVLVVSYEGMGISKQAIPSQVLYRSTIANDAPKANAGADLVITLPNNTTALIGSGTDADGTISSFKWEKLSGPNGDMILNPHSAITTVSKLEFGVYQYKLTVTDNNGATSSDIVWVIVVSKLTVLEQTQSRSVINNGNPPALHADSANAQGSKNLNSFKLSKNNELKLYPNPVKSFADLDITTAANNSKLFLSVYNSLGMLVNSRQIYTSGKNTIYRFNMTGLGKGIYTMVVTFGDGQKISHKFIKD